MYISYLALCCTSLPVSPPLYNCISFMFLFLFLVLFLLILCTYVYIHNIDISYLTVYLHIFVCLSSSLQLPWKKEKSETSCLRRSINNHWKNKLIYFLCTPLSTSPPLQYCLHQAIKEIKISDDLFLLRKKELINTCPNTCPLPTMPWMKGQVWTFICVIATV